MFPDYDQFLSEVWGWGSETTGLLPLLPFSANMPIGTNPPFTATDFYAWFPWFGGTPTTVTGTLDGNTGVVTGVSSFTGLAAGQLVAGSGIQAGSVILSVNSGASTLTLNKVTSAVGVSTLTVFTAPLVPLPILTAYINLASNCIQQARWQDTWSFAMALCIAHYLTLWLSSASQPNGTQGQAAASGLAMGIKISKSAGDVSVGIKPIEYSDWGTYGLTTYGQQLASFAAVFGSAGMLLI